METLKEIRNWLPSLSSEDDKPEAYDFIVVGGGTAGNTVAGRLAEKETVSVLVIEAGVGNPQDIDKIYTPARAFELRGSEYDWCYESTFIDRPDYKRVEKPNTRGKVLGGSSQMNYYTWVPGSKATFDDWAAYGGDTWNWDNCYDYFHKPATYFDEGNLYETGLKDMWTTGPLEVAHAELVPQLHPFRDALRKAWTSKGHSLTEDVYSGTMHGLTTCITSIHNGKRSGSDVFIRGKPNVTLMHSSQTQKLILEGNTVTGVLVQGPDGKTHAIKAKREVIVAAGVFESPKLLMLSGIGPASHLKEKGIKPVVDSMHVGQNLLDHPIMPHVFRLKDGYGLDNYIIHPGPKHEEAVKTYGSAKDGPLRSGLLELVAFPRIDERLEKDEGYRKLKEQLGGKDPYGPGGQPHFEIDFVPVFADAFQYHIPKPVEGDYLTVIVDLLRPTQKGEVKLKTTDPLEKPHINLNFLANDTDIVALREGVLWVDDILMNGEGFKDIILEDYPKPLPRDDPDAMKKEILERSQTGYHPCGTCRLSKNVVEGVVDPDLAVHGVNRLRVIDASVFPLIPDCRIQNAVYMVAEKGADIIKAAHKDLYG